MDTERDQFVADAVEAFRGMNALRTVQSFLKKRTAGSGRSWPEISSRLSEYLDEEGFISRSDVIDLIIDLRSRSHKYVSISPITDIERVTALMYSSTSKPNGPWAARFPFFVPSDMLAEFGPDPVHVATRSGAEGVEMFFTAARIGKRIEEISIDDIVMDARSNYAGVDKMYAERIERRQAYDVVFVPRNNGPLQIRVDSFATMGRERADAAREAVQNLMTEIGLLPKESRPEVVNLFPAIQSIYNDAAEGSLTGLMFECSSGANRRELLRKGSATSDLRQEAYHAAGVAKTDIVAYWLSVLLRTSTSEVEVTLPGSVRGLANDWPLTSFEIVDCTDETSLRSVVDILLRHAEHV